MRRTPTGWRALMVMFTLTGVIEALAYGHFGAFTPLYLRELRVAPEDIPFWTGILGSVAFVIGIPLLPFWGVWAERYGRKLIIVRSSYISALLFAIAAASQNIWWLLFARFLVGFVLGNTGLMLALQSETTPRQRLGMAVALVSSGIPLGVAIGPYFGSLIVEASNIRALLLVDAGLILAVAVMLTLLVHEPPRRSDDGVSLRRMLQLTYQNIVRTPVILRLFVSYFFASMASMLVTPFFPLRIEALYDGPALARTIGMILTVAGLAQAFATPVWGRIGDRSGHRRILLLCLLLTAITLVGQALAGQLSLLFGWRIAFGVVQGAVGALIMALIALRVVEAQRAAVLTMSLLPLQFAWFLGPLLGAVLSPLGIQFLFVVGAGLTLLAVAPIITLEQETEPRRQVGESH